MAVGLCKKCNKEFLVTELSLLPDGEEYVRALAINSLKGLGAPAIPHSEVCSKHGYDLTDVFCPDCLEKLLD